MISMLAVLRDRLVVWWLENSKWERRYLLKFAYSTLVLIALICFGWGFVPVRIKTIALLVVFIFFLLWWLSWGFHADRYERRRKLKIRQK